MPKIFNIETRGGEPVTIQGKTITPFSQSVQIRFPGLWKGGLVWNRPTSILAVGEDGQEQVIPVPDVTRQAQWALLAGSLVVILLMRLIFRKTQ